MLPLPHLLVHIITISTSQVAEITGVNHHAWSRRGFTLLWGESNFKANLDKKLLSITNKVRHGGSHM
jgi:hypothetical protein